MKQEVRKSIALSYKNMKHLSRIVMGLLYIGAGINHFRNPGFYLQIMPRWLPWHEALVQASGVCEIICGLLVLYSGTARVGGWLTILLLIAIFPANIQMAIDWVHTGHPNTWVAIARLPLQLVLVWWAYVSCVRGDKK